jgi:hypothetical protein
VKPVHIYCQITQPGGRHSYASVPKETAAVVYSIHYLITAALIYFKDMGAKALYLFFAVSIFKL